MYQGVPLSFEPKRTLSAAGPEECVRRVGIKEFPHSGIQNGSYPPPWKIFVSCALIAFGSDVSTESLSKACNAA